MTHRLPIACLVSSIFLLGACTPNPEPAAPVAESHDMDFLADNAIWQMQRREKLLQPDGWTSLVGLHWIELKAHYVGSSAGSGIRLANGPPKLGLLQQQDGRVYLTPEQGVALTLDGAPLRGRAELRTDTDPSPSVVGFDDGKGRITVIERGGSRALRVQHAEAEARTQFKGLEYWPPDESWRIEARFEPHAPGRTLEIANILGTLEPMANPGAVVFERDGKPYRLEAVDEGDGALFLILADRTSGHGSYGAGRYIDAGKPAADGGVTVDFNRAYNPPCAFTAFATCPLPPPGNRLDLAVAAGEKNYRGGAH
ncbi:MAG: DUF1684 domain-containing protein [Luteimonas sp.]